jgi:serine/threonine-protein kinase RsbT
VVVLHRESHPLKTDEDVVAARRIVREKSIALKFRLVDQTRIVTATSELARNAIIYGLGGEMVLEILDDDGREGLRLSFIDQGPGIADVELALTDGFTSGSGMGLGLSGSKRLMNEFEIDTAVGRGTKVTVVRWK